MNLYRIWEIMQMYESYNDFKYHIENEIHGTTTNKEYFLTDDKNYLDYLNKKLIEWQD